VIVFVEKKTRTSHIVWEISLEGKSSAEPVSLPKSNHRLGFNSN
jgi:hypothetical protein